MTNKNSPTGQLLLSLFATTKTVAAVTFSASALKSFKFKRLCDLNHKKLYKNII